MAARLVRVGLRGRAGAACAVAALVAPALGGAGGLRGQAPTATLLVALNGVRAAHGLPRLRTSARLEEAALAHDREMLRFGFFGHSSRNGRAFWRRVQRWYPPRGRGWAVGENLLAASPGATSSSTLAAWLASPEHRSILLDPAWVSVGIAVVHAAKAPGVYEGEATTVITADFGRPG